MRVLTYLSSKFQKMGLRKQLSSLSLFAVISLLIFSLIYSFTLFRASAQQMDTYAEVSLHALIQEMNRFDESVSTVHRNFGFNSVVASFVNSDDAGYRYQLSNTISILTQTIVDSSSQTDAISLTDLSQIMIGSQEATFMQTLMHLRQDLPDEPENENSLIYISRNNKLLCVSKSLSSIGTEHQYYVVSEENLHTIKKQISQLNKYDNIYFYITDKNHSVLACNKSTATFDNLINKKKVRTIAYESENWNIYANIIPSFYSPFRSNKFVVIFVFFSSITIIFMSYLIYRNIASPIENIIEFADDYGKYFNKNRLSPTGSYEITRLINSINAMLDDLQDLNHRIMKTQEQLYLAQLSEKQAELAALQIQMNPHFLYNTLDCIQGMALYNKLPDIAHIATAMSSILRYSIKGATIVPLQKELDTIKDYLRIIQIRHQNRYHIYYDISLDTVTYMIPKMSMQPIVENAVFHGLETVSTDASLWLTTRLLNDHLLITIENSGKDITTEKSDELNNSFKANIHSSDNLFESNPHIGLINIDKRIKVLYGGDYGLHIAPREGNGTVVTIILPKIVNQ